MDPRNKEVAYTKVCCLPPSHAHRAVAVGVVVVVVVVVVVAVIVVVVVVVVLVVAWDASAKQENPRK